MTLANLCVLHLYSYSKPKGVPCSLKQFIQKLNPIAVSTCMRHLYFFSSEQLSGNQKYLDQLIYQLNNPGKHQAPVQYDYVQGEKAYALLLYWAVGGLNSKKRFHDHRILGTLRSSLRSYEISKKASFQNAWSSNKYLSIALLEDSKRLHEWLNSLPVESSLEAKIVLVYEACKNCAWAREHGIFPFIKVFDYSGFANESLMMERIQQQLDRMEDYTKQALKKSQKTRGDIGFLFAQQRVHLEQKLDDIAQLKQQLFPNEQAMMSTPLLD